MTVPSYIRNAPFTESWRAAQHRQMCNRRRLRRARKSRPDITVTDLWLEDILAGRA